MELNGHLVRMRISFPAYYPNGAAPSFTLDSSTTLDITNQQELIRVGVVNEHKGVHGYYYNAIQVVADTASLNVGATVHVWNSA